MDKQLDIRFDRVEKALGTLVDSIAKYNPSTHLAHDFVAADADLGKGLEELETHQFNYRRLQDLRAASASLDAQIKETLRLLANTRRELVSTPATVFPDGARHYYDIDYDELLRYAHMISKTTIPPAGALNSIPTPPVEPAQGGGGGGGGGGGSIEVGIETAATTPGATTTGVATPSGGGGGGSGGSGGTPLPNGVQSATNGMTPQPSQPNEPPPSSQQPPLPSSQQPQQQQQQQPLPTATAGASFNTVASTNTNTTLPEHINAHLNPYAQYEFAPWPGEDSVRGGSLAALALLADRGVDPEGYDPEEERARREREEEEERRRREEWERREREERDRRIREDQARIRAEREREQAEAWRRGSVVGGAGAGAGAGAAAAASAGVGAGPGAGPGSGPGGPASSPTGEKRQFQFMGDLDDDDD